MTFTLKPKYLALWATILLYACNPSVNEAQELDPVYGQELAKLYKSKGVKEVFIEEEQSNNKTVTRTKQLVSYQLLNKSGLVTRLETAFGDKISRRVDTEYDTQGKLVVTTMYDLAANQTATSGREGIVWRPASRKRMIASGSEAAGKYTWDATKEEWWQTSTIRTWEKNDTTYEETRDLHPHYLGPSWEVTRTYAVGSSNQIQREDQLSFSPKGMGESDYSYTKVENGKITEAGDVKFEPMLFAYTQQHPEARQQTVSKHGYSTVMDKLARQYTGELEPNKTFTCNAKGHLVKKISYGRETTYQRHASGLLVASKQVYSANVGILTYYYYNDKGLLVKEVSRSLRGEPGETFYYRYTYYGK
ncbi:hypothetical protein [Pontibacter pudoricolor]|uniref:hypothetical protein n=1 Tax=Pontibacter pudoricolor TaxID=2694930 RepID=UPI0013914744|nr:hypothetical protein [Pontibacter pudoricolor]